MLYTNYVIYIGFSSLYKSILYDYKILLNDYKILVNVRLVDPCQVCFWCHSYFLWNYG